MSVPYPCVIRVPFRTFLDTFVFRFFIIRLPCRTQNLTVFRSNIFCVNSTVKKTKIYCFSLEIRDPYHLKLSVIRYLNYIADRTVLTNWPFYSNLLKREPYRFKKSARFPSFTVYANSLLTKNGRFIMTVRLTLSYQKLTVFRR